ncbi:transglycosylase domain-containing protein [Alkalihalobacillus trypoxylicola]|uniref:Penicillin-binding protein n=1 Tax=Alkalihalobacillus trypoxylicola TaxID=519424 RepID=A0A162DN35_9BACI|nr:transglycosylase domain-containing protein [Alkalihalobacillus trypoxylicola]KYG30370.1 penicillin-binding protein [Alkalihalobacillus trypoxylicola]
MKISTGWFVIIVLFASLCYLLIETAKEFNEVKPINAVIEERVNLTEIKLSQNSYIYDRHDQLISEFSHDENRIYLPFDRIPSSFISAFVATEDHRFFDHQGYDVPGIVRAISINLRSQDIEEGASTITQQLVRNLYLTHEVSYERKFSELLYAYELENTYSKEEILELYLNTVFFHNNIYGIEAASQYYFQKTSEDLSIGEVAFLSAIPNNPSHYNPLKNKDQTELRKNWILEKMLEHEEISKDEYTQALEEEIVLHVKERKDLYPEYVTFVYDELRALISKNEGYDKLYKNNEEEGNQEIAEQLKVRFDEVLSNGVVIETALDPTYQENALSVINRTLGNGDIQGVGVIIDHDTHQIISLTAGHNYNKFDFHRAYQSYRHPGSAIKSLLVYAPYFEEKNVEVYSQVNANNACFGSYCPKNYGGAEYGHVTINQAFQHSYNTPAVRILNEVGLETAFSYLEPFQFEKVTETDQRLPTALGGFEYGMSPLEMTLAYTTFANDGKYTPSRAIVSVKDLDGNVLYEWNDKSVEVWSKETNDHMRELLSNVVANGTGRRAQFSSSYIGGKTGTSNQYFDLWFIGLTDEYTAGVWVGKDQWESIQHMNTSSPHLTIWRQILNPPS